DALDAALALRGQGMSAIVTCLGENVGTEAEAAAVADHYIAVLDEVKHRGLDVEISVKLTHLGLDLGGGIAASNLSRVARHARTHSNRVWIDMEDSAYVEATLDIFRRLQPEHPALGVCLQAYLRRTPADLESLVPMGPAIRLVKGAYKESAEVAFPLKKDVDERFEQIALRLLSPAARQAGGWTVIGTHDTRLIRRIQDAATAGGVPADAFEFALLFGIRRDEQARLAGEGRRVRILISYGEFWFPWYMRRLAERPANLWFLARSLFTR
ncbi:MAG TPA: proline dehydrogenase family protein, partial [Patescibacteria group bacterium]|nr:proline dehydrogenase family protein [Patescibacteria group bacterium]